MYGKWVTITRPDFIIKIWVDCVPSDSDDFLQKKAIKIIKQQLDEGD